MGNVLVLLEHAEGKVRAASLPAITFARKAAELHGGELIGLVVGEGVDKAAQEAVAYVSKVLAAEAPGLGTYLAETWSKVVVKVAKEQGATVVCGTATNLGKDLFPRVAALLEAGQASDVVAVLGPRTFKRPQNAGNAIATVEVTTPVVVATVRQTDFPAAQPAGAAGAVSKVDAGPVDAQGAEFVSLASVKSARPELTLAKVIVSGGRGMKSGENFNVLGELTDLLGGAMGATRAACDAGMVPNDLQVGQTGKVVAPDLYIAVALSGAIQHLAGMKGSKVIVAVNKDEEAPIFQVADYGLVSTWEKAMPEMIAKAKELKASR
ncbi:MAG TPA: FAD-binding protein [Polyangia bacterium]|jgi:electron transfer flavoprotein alpha subunit